MRGGTRHFPFLPPRRPYDKREYVHEEHDARHDNAASEQEKRPEITFRPKVLTIPRAFVRT